VTKEKRRRYGSSKLLVPTCPGACIIKLFMAVINSVVQDSAFAIVSHFLLALTNILAFYVKELITTIISFMIQALVQYDTK
jgi:hypothetical protein